jgi:hypothetical protein
VNRTLAEARCQSRHHLLARLVVGEDAHRIIEIPKVFARDIRGEKIVRSFKFGGMTIDLDDESDPGRWVAPAVGCACGSDFTFSPADLVNLTRPTDDDDDKIPVLMMKSRTADGVSS